MIGHLSLVHPADLYLTACRKRNIPANPAIVDYFEVDCLRSPHDCLNLSGKIIRNGSETLKALTDIFLSSKATDLKLDVLNLANNYLCPTDVPAIVKVVNACKCHTLIVTNNMIGDALVGFPVPMKHVKHIDMAYTNMSRDPVLLKTPKLESLDISNNKPTTLTFNFELKALHAVKCELKDQQLNLVHMPKLEVLSLSDNKLNTDRKVRDILRLANNLKKFYIDNNIFKLTQEIIDDVTRTMVKNRALITIDLSNLPQNEHPNFKYLDSVVRRDFSMGVCNSLIYHPSLMHYSWLDTGITPPIQDKNEEMTIDDLRKENHLLWASIEKLQRDVAVLMSRQSKAIM